MYTIVIELLKSVFFNDIENLFRFIDRAEVMQSLLETLLALVTP